MKRLSKKILLILSLLMLVGLMGCSAQSSEINDFNKLGDLTKQLNFSAKCVSGFSNGFLFAVADIMENELLLCYKNPQTAETINCYMKAAPETAEPLPPNTQQWQEGDVLFTFYQFDYKFVPPDYEETEEDTAAVNAGSLQLAWGSSEVEEHIIQGVVWQEDDVRYMLSGMDLTLTADEMLDMAAQIVNSDNQKDVLAN